MPTMNLKEKITQLNSQYSKLFTKAETLAAGYDEEKPMPKEVRLEIESLLGQSDEIKAQISLMERVTQGQDFSRDLQPTDVDVNWRKTLTEEGDVRVDPLAWREMEVKTPFSLWPIRIRYQVPLDVQGKDYPSAFESYMRKGVNKVGPNDRKTLYEGSDAAGGFLAPEAYMTEMLRKTAAAAAVRALARVITTSRDVVKWPKVKYSTDDKYTSGVRLNWTGELPSSSTIHRVTDPVFGLVGIPIHTAMASMPLSNDLIEDSAFDVVGLSSDLMGEAFGLGEDDVFLNGDGVSKPMGMITRITTGDDQIGFVVSGSAASITADGLIDLFFGLPAQYRRGAKFLMNSNTAKVARKLKDGGSTGRYLWDSMQAPNFGGLSSPVVQDTLLAAPVAYDEFMPDLGANAFPILFADFSGYLIADRVGLSLQRLEEVYAELNMTLLLARRRVGGDVIQPWRMRSQKCST